MARSHLPVIHDEIPAGGRFGLFATRPPAEHLVLGVCDLETALGFVVASTNDHPFDVGAIAVLDPARLEVLVRRVAQWMAVHRRGNVMRYTTVADGRAAMRAVVRDSVDHRTVLTIGGADRFAVADTIAAALNAARHDVPVRS